MSKGSEWRGDRGTAPSAGWAADDVLLPLRERLRDWTGYNVASSFLGKALGVIDPSATYTDVKHVFISGTGGVKLMDILIFLVDQGFLESGDNNFEFRWQRAGVTAGLVGA